MSERRGPPVAALLSGLFLILVGVGWLLDTTGAVDVPWHDLLPWALVLVGVAIVVTAWTGGGSGLVTIGVILAVVTASATVLNISFRGGVGERTERPSSASQLPERYEQTVGKLTVDLSRVELSPGATEVEVSLGIGALRVSVPEDVSTQVRARGFAGRLEVKGREGSGISPRLTEADPGFDEAEVRLVLIVSVGIGEAVVEAPSP